MVGTNTQLQDRLQSIGNDLRNELVYNVATTYQSVVPQLAGFGRFRDQADSCCVEFSQQTTIPEKLSYSSNDIVTHCLPRGSEKFHTITIRTGAVVERHREECGLDFSCLDFPSKVGLMKIRASKIQQASEGVHVHW